MGSLQLKPTKIHRASPHKGQRHLSICGREGVTLAKEKQRLTCGDCIRKSKQKKYSKNLARAKTPQEVVRTFTPQEIKFAQHPLVMIDPRKAAMDAGYSEKSNPYTLRKKLVVLIRQIQLTRAEDYLHPGPDDVISEMAKMAMMNQEDYFKLDDRGARVPKRIEELTRDQLAAVSDIEMEYRTIEDKDGNKTEIAVVTSIRLHSKLNALRSLAAMIGVNDPEFRRRWYAGDAEDKPSLKNISTPDLKVIEQILRSAHDMTQSKIDESDIVEGEFSVITAPKKR